MKLLILGHGGHGKDTVGSYICKLFKMTSISSSLFAMDKCVWPVIGYQYETKQGCFEDRHNRRQEWFDLIRKYNEYDPAQLVKDLLSEYDIYTGLRSAEEYEAGKHLFDFIFWVDASQRAPLEPSMEIEYNSDEMILINNNHSVEAMELAVRASAPKELFDRIG
jgi:hypothetical protein